MSINPLFSRFPTKRRSARVAVPQHIGVMGEDPNGVEFRLDGKATNLNYYGGAISIAKQLPIGATVTVRNVQKLEASVKIVSRFRSVAGVHSYGVKFVNDAAGFWGIHFPISR